MGVLQRFERRVEEIVNGAFARAFKSEVQPVEVAAALQRECNDKAAIVARGRTMVPNSFTVELGDHDFERLDVYAEPLGGELADMVAEHAQQQGYTFIGPVRVDLEHVPELETGVFRIRSAAVAGVTPRADSSDRLAAPAELSPRRDASANPRPVLAPDGAAEATTLNPAARPDGGPGQPRPDVPSPARVEIGGESYPLNRAVTVLGRGQGSDLRIDDPGVSRSHAEIRLHRDLAEIVDLGSTNGLVIDGQRVERAALEDGTEVRLGRTVLVFRRGRGDR